MGQHKYNKTAILAKQGKLPKKEKPEPRLSKSGQKVLSSLLAFKMITDIMTDGGYNRDR